MSSNKVVVVIPVHKPALTQNELASLKQCYKILGSHPIRIVAPEGMDMSVYQNAVPGCEVIFISPEWLSGIQQYNKLKISKYFYDLFKDYEYLLTYELDAWVFRDELLYWCDKGYDFIGAPWFEGYDLPIGDEILKGGNSGFSLRKISTAIRFIIRIKQLKRWREFWFRFHLQGMVHFENVWLFKILFRLKGKKFLPYFLQDWWNGNEDYFWSYLIANTFTDYTVAPNEESLKFSFEVKPSFLFEKNNNNLPFGCHAWEKYEPEFWKKFINTEF